jgi:hypothetical protein
MNDKVIFVDIDGPISYGTWMNGKVKINDNLTIPYDWIQSDCDALTKIINETGAKVVISSDWKFHYTAEQLGEVFKHYGIPNVIIGETSRIKVKMSSPLEWDRADQIMEWVVNHKLEMRDWVAIDDLQIGKIFGNPDRSRSGKRIHVLNHIECDGDHSEHFKGISLSQKVSEILDWFDDSISIDEITRRRVSSEYQIQDGEIKDTDSMLEFFYEVGNLLIPEHLKDLDAFARNREIWDIARRVATKVGFTFTKQMNIDISQQLESLKIKN